MSMLPLLMLLPGARGGYFNWRREKMAQSAESFQVKVKKFDPDLHGNNLYDAFQEFVDSFHYEYEVVAKQPAATLTDEEKAAWVLQDKRKVFLGKYASRTLQRHSEDEVAVAERSTITFDAMVGKLKERYKPTKNKTMANYEFHQMVQGKNETWDMWIAKVKHEADFCDFKCESAACTVRDTLVRDRIVSGTSNDEIRRAALKKEWTLADVIKKGKVLEAASKGADRISGQLVYQVYQTKKSGKPGKFSKKYRLRKEAESQFWAGKQKHQGKADCQTYSSKRCEGGKKCLGAKIQCFDCGKMGHFKGSKASQKKKARRVDQSEEETTSSTNESESTDEASES